jgi:hypothetical protein
VAVVALPSAHLSASEQAQLRALVYVAYDRPTWANVEAIIDWWYLLPIARGDMNYVRAVARALLKDELRRQKRQPSVDGLVGLLRRTAP